MSIGDCEKKFDKKMSEKLSQNYQIPDWINNTFLEKSLQDFYDDKSVFLKSFQVVSVVADRRINYWSDVLRLTLSFTNSRNPLK